jgi:hypothetical protein
MVILCTYIISSLHIEYQSYRSTMSDASTGITSDEVRQGVADCTAAGKRPGMRPVWRAIVERTGKRPSFSTVARYLADIAAGSVPSQPPGPTAPPDQVVNQLQQMAPAVWQAALVMARQDLATEMQVLAERLRTTEERERDLLTEMDDAQARAATAEEQRLAAEQRAQALHEQMRAQTFALEGMAASHRNTADAWDQRERELQHRLGQLERETATLAAAGHHARESLREVTAERDQLRIDLVEARRRSDADVGLNAHLREQVDGLVADVASAHSDLAAAHERERQALIRVAGAEQRVLVRDPLLREVRASLGRLERRIAQQHAVLGTGGRRAWNAGA